MKKTQPALEVYAVSNVISDNNGIRCAHCLKWNKHSECGSYEVLIPLCIHCNQFVEGWVI